MAKTLSKTQKKIDTQLCKTLQDCCENHLKNLEGFTWITHQADYANFPASLLISCIFTTDANINTVQDSDSALVIKQHIQQKLLKSGVRLKDVRHQIRFDSEEACERDHGGNWTTRLSNLAGSSVPKNRPSR
ncbi:MAG: Fis family transcriptional regulator [Marinagarivorans sp.]|nr:Fis family transcriptional regulator [Marinagarivorans sp.]